MLFNTRNSSRFHVKSKKHQDKVYSSMYLFRLFFIHNDLHLYALQIYSLISGMILVPIDIYNNVSQNVT